MQTITESQLKIYLDASDFSPIRILHVDDDPSFLEISKLILLDTGNFKIDHASCVDEALEKLATEDYDLVISDYEMPQKDGLQLLKELREQKNEIPFILFTGKGREEVVIRALNLGADYYVSKQGSPETVYGELSHNIQTAVERYRAKHQNINDAMVLRSVHEGIVTSDENFTITAWNKGAEVMFGWSAQEVVGKSVSDVFKHMRISPTLKKLMRITREKGGFSGEVTFQSKSGQEQIAELNIVSVIKENGKFTGFVAVCRRITERKKAEGQVKQLLESLQLQISKMPIGLIVWDKDFRVRTWNPAAVRIFGFSEQEAMGRHPYNLIVPKHVQPQVDSLWGQLLKGDETAHSVNENITKEGKTIVCSWTNTPMKKEDGTVLGVLSMVQDISERNRAENTLKESEEKFRSLAEHSPNMIFINKRGKVVYANEKCEETMGYTREEFYSANFNFFSLIDSEYVETLKSSYSKHTEGNEVSSLEYRLTTKNGEKIDAILTTKLITYEGELAILGIVTDITERKKVEAELRSSYGKMEIMNEKLRVVGGLTRHDVRNKLSAIMGYSYLLKKHNGDQPYVVESVDKMVQLVKEIEKILDFSRAYELLGDEKPVMVNVGKALDEAKALFSSPLPNIINDCHDLNVLADSFLQQMFYNFIDNTKKHGKTAATIKVYHEDADDGYLRLIYEDDGIGISTENKMKLFREGFSTGGSTGFGLFLSKKMMEVYGWEIEETGEPGKGAKFVMKIPNKNKNGQATYQIRT